MPPVRRVKHDTDVVVPKAGETYVADDGTVSQVLDDHIDANYEPTEEELLEFADWIGMKLPQDSEFLWLARDALKTPLPKEWKPCSTGDGDVYYFNFKTGESSWDHPMDQIFRQRFQEEKARSRTPESASTGTAAARSTGGLSSSVYTSTPPAVRQTHVMMTDAGVLRRDGGLSLAPGPSAAVASTSAGTKGAGSGNAHNEVKPVMHYPPSQQQQQQRRGTEAAPRTKTTTPQSTGALSSTTGITDSKSALISASLGPKKVGIQERPPSGPSRLLSEAERALEERVHREMQRALETERTKIEDAHRGVMSTLQCNFDKDAAEIRSADAARRAASSQEEEEARKRRLQQTRSACEERYGDELRLLEREAESNATKLQKLEAEAARATSGNTQRAAIEAELKTALAKQRAVVEAEAEKQQQAAMANARSVHAVAMQKIREEEQRKITATRQTWQRKFDMEERALALQTETQRKRLEGQLKDLEETLADVVTPTSASVSAATPPTTVSSPPPCHESLGERLACVATAKAFQLRDIEAAATREQSDVRTDGESTLAELTKQIEIAQQAAQLGSTDAKPADPLNRAASCPSNRLGVVTPQGRGAQPASVTLSAAFTQELNRVRLACGKERQERLLKLRTDREAALAAVETLLPSTSSSKSHASDTSDVVATAHKGGSGSGPTTLEQLKAAHAAELEAKRALYTKIEENMKTQYAREVADAARATTETLQSALVAQAVDTEIDFYIQEATARYDRMRAEAEAKRDKALADHQLAMDAYERRRIETAARQAREQQGAREAFIQDRLDAAVAAERAKLAADHAATMARLAARYDEERGAIKAEVEEEVLAYKAAEEEQIQASASGTGTFGDKGQGAAEPFARADTLECASRTAALCAHVMKQVADRQAEWLTRKRDQAERRAALEEKQSALQAERRRMEQHVEVLRKEVADLAAACATAGVQQPFFPPASTPLPPPDASIVASMPPADGLLRATHETSMQAIEKGYRAQELALEAELQAWRGKAQALRPSQPQQSYSSTSLGTPRRQVLVEAAVPGGVATYRTSTPYALHHQPSPIVSAPAGTSLQGTPTIPMAFEDSPWQLPTRAGVPPLQTGMLSRGLSMTTGVLSTGEAILSYEHQQRSLQQRQASLEAAREAWQLHRRREAEVQQHSHVNPTTVGSASQHDHRYEGGEPSTQGTGSLVTSRREEELRLVLSRLSERLDSLTREALQQQQRSRHHHRRSRSALHAGVHAAMTSSPSTRAHSARSHHRNVRGAPQRDMVDSMTCNQPRYLSSMNAATAASLAKVPPQAKQPSILDSARASPLQQSRKANIVGGFKERGHGGALSCNLSRKWDTLLSQRHHHHSR
ncbi:hypothetical protein JKF63_03665 [Porcisia hertigi]|uniref:WW domain-containing protein n=1 Tax=Porcisia hertigi TaxID=2761500 RepID=A0A836L9T9_9TRYP|nr:hypothetical protein JKF63_03665 [Porcisia hertigi]